MNRGDMNSRNAALKAHPTIGVCGLDCGLCPRYYTAGKSRCPGCGGPGFLSKHPSCSFISCAVKKKGIETCGLCGEFPCSKFKSEEEYRRSESSSYPPSRKQLSNSYFIRENGIKDFLRLQKKGIRLLERMIRDYDDGRSRSFFCRAAALLDPDTLTSCLNEANKLTRAGVAATIAKGEKAGMLRAILVQAALRRGIVLSSSR